MKPIIGITSAISSDEITFSLSAAYCKAVFIAGGIPIIIAPLDNTPDVLDVIDGLILSGGGDIDPFFYGMDSENTNGEISPSRDFFELQLCKACMEHEIPILGICRGIQVMATAFNGKIIQDIHKTYPKSFKHMQQAPRYYPTHNVVFEKGCRLRSIYGKDCIRVNSFHHQSVSLDFGDFFVCGKSPDGITEALELNTHSFAIGVQWHPEHMVLDSFQPKLFKSFIAESIKNMGGRKNAF